MFSAGTADTLQVGGVEGITFGDALRSEAGEDNGSEAEGEDLENKGKDLLPDLVTSQARLGAGNCGGGEQPTTIILNIIQQSSSSSSGVQSEPVGSNHFKHGGPGSIRPPSGAEQRGSSSFIVVVGDKGGADLAVSDAELAEAEAASRKLTGSSRRMRRIREGGNKFECRPKVSQMGWKGSKLTRGDGISTSTSSDQSGNCLRVRVCSKELLNLLGLLQRKLMQIFFLIISMLD